MQLIAADIGNSSIRLAVGGLGVEWDSAELVRFSYDDPAPAVVAARAAIWAVCSVNAESLSRLQDWIATHRPNDQIHALSRSEIGLESALPRPQTTGIDRLVAAWMAIRLAPSSGPLVIVDAGTAVTVDLVDADRVFQGGFIFPGFTTSLRSLSRSTDALPDMSGGRRPGRISKVAIDEPGHDTRSAILRGVMHSQVSTTRHLVQTLADQQRGTVEVFVTGGGMAELQPWLPPHWRYVEWLVLQGTYHLGLQRAGDTP